MEVDIVRYPKLLLGGTSNDRRSAATNWTDTVYVIMPGACCSCAPVCKFGSWACTQLHEAAACMEGKHRCLLSNCTTDETV
jgi:hypothetical protein